MDWHSSLVLWQNLKWSLFLWHYVEKPGKASIKSESVIQATSITIQWTAPADDGGSPITGFQMILQKDGTEIKKVNITDPGTTSYSFRGLEKDTNYTVKLFSRNVVFEGDPTVWNVKTKFEGEESKVISWLSTVHQSFFRQLRFVVSNPVLTMLSACRIIRFSIFSVCPLLSGQFPFPLW